MSLDYGIFDHVGTPDLNTALAKAQGEITAAKKDSTNPHFKSKYADLASVWDACRDALSKNGLSVIQVVMPGPAGLMLRSTLRHASGQEAPHSDFPILPLRQDSQSIGSAMTYARRYSLAALVGVAPEDDDGNAAGTTDGSGVAPKPQAPVFAHELKTATPAVAPTAPLPAFKPPAPKSAQPQAVPEGMPPMPPPLPGSTLYNKIEETPVAKAAKKLAEKDAAPKQPLKPNDDGTYDVPW